MAKTKPSCTLYLRIGEISRRSGISAKAVRLYEERGLLKPSARSEAGYRLYGPDALRRLMRIVLLRRMGLGLADIGLLLQRDGALDLVLLDERIEALERELVERRTSLAKLRRLATQLRSETSNNLDQLLEGMHMWNEMKFDVSDADRALLRERVAQIGDEKRSLLREAWPSLLRDVRSAMDAGTPADHPSVVDLVQRYRAIAPGLPAFDTAAKGRLHEALAARADLLAQAGLDQPLFEYLTAAVAVVRALEAK
jgi:DNA-binding transcriptional MerR regulator